MAKSKYPQMPFDTRDWLCCPELKVLPPDIRGLWIDVLCYMWESPERGVMVSPSGQPYTKAEIAALIGLDSQGSPAWIDRLIDAGVCGVRDDGAIISRRMVREHKLSQVRAAAGQKGGRTTHTGQERASGKEKKRKSTEPKLEFAQYVHLTQREYDRLVSDYGKDAVSWMIQKLNNTVGSNTNKYRYTNDNLAIRNWVVDAYNERNGNKLTETGGGLTETGGSSTFSEVPDN
ncbi:MAG: hypothetical protein ACI4TM_06710 [Candidatus Cryptobacteroides sp.]